jgi:hypothetical protein
VAQPLADVEVNITFVPTDIPVTVVPVMVPAELVTVPLLAKVTLYVVPVQTGLCAVRSGAMTAGGLIVIICGAHPVAVAVIVTAEAIAIPVIEVAVTVPVEAVMVALFGFDILMLYVLPLQMPALKLAGGDAHGVVQSAGLVTIAEVTQAPLVAVIVTLVPTVIPVTVLPLTVPVLAVTVAPALALKATLYVPAPMQTP